MIQISEGELHELRKDIKRIAESQMSLSMEVSRVLNTLEGDERMGVNGHGKRLNSLDERVTNLETKYEVTIGKVVGGFFVFSFLSGFIGWIINKVFI